jgi:hypothetical protein
MRNHRFGCGGDLFFLKRLLAAIAEQTGGCL